MVAVHFSKRMVARLPLIQPAYVQFRVKQDPHARVLGFVLVVVLSFLAGALLR